jgi:hypothetical protein
LVEWRSLPDFVKEIRPPPGLTLASDMRVDGRPLLEGDIDALDLIDLDKEGLSEYRSYLTGRGRQRYRDTYEYTERSTSVPPIDRYETVTNYDTTRYDTTRYDRTRYDYDTSTRTDTNRVIREPVLPRYEPPVQKKPAVIKTTQKKTKTRTSTGRCPFGIKAPRI